ncbi:hypothetical protein [Paenibacillus gorillae]|uniref:hypothetical protein n=1 Tax=Paenibacillus gorillae TaxID=1243662 RepID=UPI0005A79ECE|nr:hypothetical protein [Paenibacillus gorillae]
MLRSRHTAAVILILAAIILLFSISALVKKQEGVQNKIDRTFIEQLSNVITGFSMKLTGDESAASYQRCIASVAAAAALSPLTSFERTNDLLDIALHNLYMAMLNPDYRDEIVNNVDLFRELFYTLSRNPKDEGTTNAIIKFTESLQQ